MKYKYYAYNVMFDLRSGRQRGKTYRVEGGNTPAEAKKRAISSNRRWNKVVGKKRFKAAFSHVKKVGGAKKRKTPLWSV